MKQVVLSYPNQETQEIVLVGVPRVGERIRLRNGPDARALIVRDVMWLEAVARGDEPTVLVFVSPVTGGPT